MAERVCKVCGDSHCMQLGDRDVPCTHCPTPCAKCRLDGTGAYCSTTPCACDCHRAQAIEVTCAHCQQVTLARRGENFRCGCGRTIDATNLVPREPRQLEVERFERITRENRAESFQRLADAPANESVIFDLLDGPSPISALVTEDGAVLIVISEEAGVYGRLEPEVAATLAMQLSWASIEAQRKRDDQPAEIVAPGAGVTDRG